MIQIVFTDNGKVHTVTFSGDNNSYWAYKFIDSLHKVDIKSEIRII